MPICPCCSRDLSRATIYRHIAEYEQHLAKKLEMSEGEEDSGDNLGSGDGFSSVDGLSDVGDDIAGDNLDGDSLDGDNFGGDNLAVGDELGTGDDNGHEQGMYKTISNILIDL
jgi:hypothetical protein